MDKGKLAFAITKALAYTENGGKPNMNNLSSGKSGEMKSIFQFEPSTWKLYAKQELGDPNAPLTNENEAVVVHKKVSDWLDAGYKPEQIASMWNAGERRPDAYKEGWSGTNSSGVHFDTPTYAKKVADYTKQFMNESQSDDSTPSGAPQMSNPPVDIVSRIKQIMGGGSQQPANPQQPAQAGLLQKLQLQRVSSTPSGQATS